MDDAPRSAKTTKPSAPPLPAHAWGTPTLVFTAGIAVAAKIAGVVIAPGLRGIAPGDVVERALLLSGTLSYALTGLFVALLGVSSFELAKNERLSSGIRFPVVALSGLVVALASPAVIERVPRGVAGSLVVAASVVALLAGLSAARAAHTRVLGIVLVLLSTTATLRLVAYQVAVAGGESGKMIVFEVGQAIATVAILLHGGALVLSGAWLASRRGWGARLLVNGSIVLAFALTWLAGRQSESPSVVEQVLRVAIWSSAGMPTPFGLGPIAVFLLPASVLLALVTLVLRARAPSVLAPLTLALVAHGAYDVPLQALSVVVAAGWALLAQTDPPEVTSSRP